MPSLQVERLPAQQLPEAKPQKVKLQTSTLLPLVSQLVAQHLLREARHRLLRSQWHWKRVDPQACESSRPTRCPKATRRHPHKGKLPQRRCCGHYVRPPIQTAMVCLWQSSLDLQRVPLLPALQTPTPGEASSAAHPLPTRWTLPVHLAVQGPAHRVQLHMRSLKPTLRHLKESCLLFVGGSVPTGPDVGL